MRSWIEYQGVSKLNHVNRRQFVVGAASLAWLTHPSSKLLAAESKFQIGVISDEISHDFDHACYVIAKEYGLHYVELREIWGKNLQDASDAQLADAQRILAKYALTVTDIA